MKKEEFIEVGHLCTNHSIEISFIIELAEIDLIEIKQLINFNTSTKTKWPMWKK